MGRRSRGTARSSVRVFAIEETDDLGESGPPGLPVRREVPDGAAYAPRSADGLAPQGSAGDAPPTEEPLVRRPWSNRTRLLVGTGLAVVALLVVGFVRGSMNESARLERVVVAGGVRPLGPDASVLWRIEPGAVGSDASVTPSSPPVVVDGTIVVAGPDVTGFDPGTGEELWRASSSFGSVAPGTRRTECAGSGQWPSMTGPLICTTFALRQTSLFSETAFEEHLVGLEVLDATTGDVTSSHVFGEGTLGAEVFADGLVTVRWGKGDQVVVDLQDLATGELRWTREIAAVRDPSGESGDQLGLWAAGDLLLLDGAGISTTLDAEGDVQPEGVRDSWTTVLGDGRSVVHRLDGTSSVLDPDGREAFVAQGRVQEFGATDGTRAGAFLVAVGGGVMDTSGAIDAPRVAALDAETGRTLWESEGTLDTPVARVGDVGILSDAGRLRAVDLRSGAQLWEAPGVRSFASAHTDGTDLYLVESSPTGGMRLTAIAADSGREVWAKDFVDSAVWGIGASGTLVVATYDGDVLGIG
ncbi:PQQ-binding-like beta-propeller repeat protein [Oerskovia sp. KBS0722]|uniref:outer membrane protein assembly factor BamB family protein n=1 Tax=Oerskovia sp. KBS0722 TaxID=1179673 RepID=UPI00110E9043|nr:PQQ-binding-like beta-propeller repeat protein [Oerskovia sp. KBS0722]QDW63743.1 PQQ-binding-like beta-propeller repeat protein [Oerskovia sp. KBS0722]